jgi:hypothetical protein
MREERHPPARERPPELRVRQQAIDAESHC